MKFTRRKKLPVVLETVEAERLLKMPNKRYLTGIRNKAIILVMLNMGLRVSEITNLRPGSINITSRKLRVVNGKEGVDRDLIITDGIGEILSEWKRRKPSNTKYFFTTLKGKKLSTRYLCDMIKRYGRKANIDKIISPHTLRHTFATEYYKQTKDIETLRRILGHADISTTTIYITLANIDVENGMKSFRGFL
ncbi:Tyrosine recombinase XerD [subsurface metagenome]|nr:tyrosine-type recombinase/integrase [Clostridia bacterium]